MPRSLHWCALLVWNIFCVELLLSRADLRHLVCNFTRSWLAIAALAFQTKSDGWIYWVELGNNFGKLNGMNCFRVGSIAWRQGARRSRWTCWWCSRASWWSPCQESGKVQYIRCERERVLMNNLIMYFYILEHVLGINAVKL